jgi:hypothetical protein
MFFEKDTSLRQEFKTFYAELQKVEAEDDDEDWIDIDDEGASIVRHMTYIIFQTESHHNRELFILSLSHSRA